MEIPVCRAIRKAASSIFSERQRKKTLCHQLPTTHSRAATPFVAWRSYPFSSAASPVAQGAQHRTRSGWGEGRDAGATDTGAMSWERAERRGSNGHLSSRQNVCSREEQGRVERYGEQGGRRERSPYASSLGADWQSMRVPLSRLCAWPATHLARAIPASGAQRTGVGASFMTPVLLAVPLSSPSSFPATPFLWRKEATETGEMSQG